MPEHDERMSAIRNAFGSANDEMIAAIEALDADAAAKAPEGAWNVARIGWHVGTTTEFLAGAMSGAIAAVVVPRPDGFEETLASLELPQKIQTFPQLEPPADVSRETAIEKLRASADAFAGAADTVTSERCGTVCVQLPFGVFSLYEIGEFTAAHIRRHLGQVERTLAAS